MKTTTLTRGQFATAAAATFASIAIVKAPARAAQFQYKSGTDNALNHPQNVRQTQMWAEVKKESGGRLDVSLFPNNELGGASAMLTQVRSGAMHFLAQDGGQLASIVPLAAIQGVGFAFKDSQTAWQAMDGDLGALVRKDLIAGGLYPFPTMWENGMREVTSGSKQIVNVEDLQGFKIRTPPGRLWIDLFKSLGAAPVPLNFNEVYTGLQTKVIDGQENPYAVIELSRLFEVQKYLSVTNHMWSGFWLVANNDGWNALPPDIKAIVNRNATKYALLARGDTARLNGSLLDKLRRRGMTIEQPKIAGFRAKLGDFYKHWKGEFGPLAWSSLEKYSGKLA
jgi:tripartite ATP-independent transporter DctP family solute receptor